MCGFYYRDPRAGNSSGIGLHLDATNMFTNLKKKLRLRSIEKPTLKTTNDDIRQLRSDLEMHEFQMEEVIDNGKTLVNSFNDSAQSIQDKEVAIALRMIEVQASEYTKTVIGAFKIATNISNKSYRLIDRALEAKEEELDSLRNELKSARRYNRAMLLNLLWVLAYFLYQFVISQLFGLPELDIPP